MISIFQSVTLDGVMQGLGRADEDTRHGFTHGGWGNGYQDEVSMAFAGEGMAKEGSLLFGHRTYDDLVGWWVRNPEPNPFTEVLTNTRKYVVSRSADTTLAYPNSTLLAGEAADTVAEIDEDVMVLGSGELVRSLHAAGLVDEYILLIHPIVLGSGTKLFGPGERTNLSLQRTIPTTTGVIIAQYAATR